MPVTICRPWSERLLAAIRVTGQLVEVGEVAPGGEGLPVPGQHDRTGLVVGVDLREQPGQSPVELMVRGIEVVGPVQPDHPDRSFGHDLELVGDVVEGHRPGTPPTRRASGGPPGPPSRPAGTTSSCARHAPWVSSRVAGQRRTIALIFKPQNGVSVGPVDRPAPTGEAGRGAYEAGKPQDPAGHQVPLDLRRPAHDALRPAVEVGVQRGVVPAAVGDAADGQGGVPDGLLRPGHEQLVHRALGAVRDPVEPVGQAPPHVQAQHLDLHHGPAEVPDLLRSEVLGMAPHPAGEVVDHLGVPGHVAELARFTLVAHHGHGQRPALTRCSDHVAGRDAGAVEEHLAELLGDPVDHPEGPLLDPGLAHGHREGRDAAVLGHVVIGPGQQQAPLGLVRVARPYLVTGDDEVVTVPVGPGAQRGEVGSGIGLAESLAPTVAAVDDAREESLL